MAKKTLEIPSREEFHRYASNLLTNADFDTERHACPGYQINRVASALNWTRENQRERNYSYKTQRSDKTF